MYARPDHKSVTRNERTGQTGHSHASCDHAQQRYDELVDKLILGSPDTLRHGRGCGESSHRHHFGVPLGQQRLAWCRFTAQSSAGSFWHAVRPMSAGPTVDAPGASSRVGDEVVKGGDSTGPRPERGRARAICMVFFSGPSAGTGSRAHEVELPPTSNAGREPAAGQSRSRDAHAGHIRCQPSGAFYRRQIGMRRRLAVQVSGGATPWMHRPA